MPFTNFMAFMSKAFDLLDLSLIHFQLTDPALRRTARRDDAPGDRLGAARLPGVRERAALLRAALVAEVPEDARDRHTGRRDAEAEGRGRAERRVGRTRRRDGV